MNDAPTPERLRDLLDYDPDTGVLTWKARTGRCAGSFNHQRAGRPAGTLRTDGYIAVKVDDVIHAAHRIIWAMVHEEWPDCVRHRNREDADNRLANLFSATRDEIANERKAGSVVAAD